MSTFALRPLDYAIVAAYLALIVAMGIYFGRKAKRSMLDYFLSHRSMPWWLAGTAMVATTFSADTPLAVTEMVVKNGVAGNWLWWSMLGSGMLTVFFFARLWRRAEVVTDVELTELRYSGKPAAFLRGFRAAYLGLIANIIVMGWVNLGMAKVLRARSASPTAARFSSASSSSSPTPSTPATGAWPRRTACSTSSRWAARSRWPSSRCARSAASMC